MTGHSYTESEDHTERVEDVLKRAAALSDELRSTIIELTQVLRVGSEGAVNAGTTVS